MASAQKGLMSMTGLSFVVGNEEIIKKSKDYPKNVPIIVIYIYSMNILKKRVRCIFTPPVQTVYATRQALKKRVFC